MEDTIEVQQQREINALLKKSIEQQERIIELLTENKALKALQSKPESPNTSKQVNEGEHPVPGVNTDMLGNKI